MNLIDQIRERIAHYEDSCKREPREVEQRIITDVYFNGSIRMVELETNLITCKDCKYYNDGVVNGRHIREPFCEEVGELSYGAFYTVDENDFCSRAEKRDA